MYTFNVRKSFLDWFNVVAISASLQSSGHIYIRCGVGALRIIAQEEYCNRRRYEYRRSVWMAQWIPSDKKFLKISADK